MFDRLGDTIVAISSPAGAGVRGIIRLSGPDALRFASTVFTVDLQTIPGRRRVMGRLRFAESGTVPAEAYVFRSPASYTRQDVVELHTLGSPPLLAELLDALVAAGARPAEPGEFTARAYFNGALDLTRVEGVAAAIHARSDAQLRASEALLHGELSRRTHVLREKLADLLALVEAQIDFVDEPVEFVSHEQVVETVTSVSQELNRLAAGAVEVERLEILPEVLLLGPPNAGKSTLFNRLTGMDRAIRSATAGTTRDVLRAPISLPGGEAMLLDTAGLPAERDEDSKPAELSQAATRRAAATADLVLLVLDGADNPAGAAARLSAALPAGRCRVVINKLDVLTPQTAARVLASIEINPPPLIISALTGEGVTALQEAISAALFSTVESHGADVLALTQRQHATLHESAEALHRTLQMLSERHLAASRWELIALEIRAAMNALSLLTGEVSTEELLARIFSRFCIGK